jgi:hypothetical protein
MGNVATRQESLNLSQASLEAVWQSIIVSNEFKEITAWDCDTMTFPTSSQNLHLARTEATENTCGQPFRERQAGLQKQPFRNLLHTFLCLGKGSKPGVPRTEKSRNPALCDDISVPTKRTFDGYFVFAQRGLFDPKRPLKCPKARGFAGMSAFCRVSHVAFAFADSGVDSILKSQITFCWPELNSMCHVDKLTGDSSRCRKLSIGFPLLFQELRLAA